jgi:cell wall-associated NlpC family hydrolase
MRRLGFVLSVAVLAALLISIATLAAAQTATPESTSELSVSQGTVTGAEPSEAVRDAAQRDIAEEESLPDYSQVVDNSQSGRFYAPGWEQGGSDSWAHGGDYASAGASTSEARFKLRVPTDGDYALYAWWPARKDNSSATKFGVDAATGTKWVEADQTTDGGMWVKLGTFGMKAGDDYVVRISPEGGQAIADAVALVRGAVSPPPEDLAPAEGGPTNGASADATTARSADVYSATSSRSERRALVRRGRTHLGTPYRHSPPYPCRAYRKEDCSCFTKVVFRHFGKKLPDSPTRQYWRHGHRVDRANLKRGDLVFFKEAGWNGPITHVAMYSGNGYVLHASKYFGKVAESKMKYIKGYFGAKRIRKLN